MPTNNVGLPKRSLSRTCLSAAGLRHRNANTKAVRLKRIPRLAARGGPQPWTRFRLAAGNNNHIGTVGLNGAGNGEGCILPVSAVLGANRVTGLGFIGMETDVCAIVGNRELRLSQTASGPTGFVPLAQLER